MIPQSRVKGGHVDQELTCCICRGVLDRPQYSVGCGHTFCTDCLTQRLNQTDKCPIDIHFSLTNNRENLQPAPRIIQNMIDKVELFCEFSDFGCDKYIRKDMMANHLKECEFNPKSKRVCECGTEFYPSRGQKRHNCVIHFKNLISGYQKELYHLEIITQRQEKSIEVLGKRLSSIHIVLLLLVVAVMLKLIVMNVKFV